MVYAHPLDFDDKPRPSLRFGMILCVEVVSRNGYYGHLHDGSNSARSELPVFAEGLASSYKAFLHIRSV